MGGRQRRAHPERAAEQALRDQEVMRANRELAAYFRGQRTEREARAALKILRAYVRERARMDPKVRPALPGMKPPPDRTVKRPAGKRGTRRRSATNASTAGAVVEAGLSDEPQDHN
jgi:hypothetical protein